MTACCSCLIYHFQSHEAIDQGPTACESFFFLFLLELITSPLTAMATLKRLTISIEVNGEGRACMYSVIVMPKKDAISKHIEFFPSAVSAIIISILKTLPITSDKLGDLSLFGRGAERLKRTHTTTASNARSESAMKKKSGTRNLLLTKSTFVPGRHLQ